MKRDADTDKRWMSAALNLARRGLGNVWPNPAVGCVVVSQGRVVGRGWTQAGGRPHAEAMALAAQELQRQLHARSAIHTILASTPRATLVRRVARAAVWLAPRL